MDEARNIIERHANAINDRDAAAYRQTMAFPFTYQNYNGEAWTIEKPAEVGVTAPLPWEIILGTDPDWSHTQFDTLNEVARSSHSTVYKVGFRRISGAGQASAAYDAIWIATCQLGHWGVQFRHNLGLRGAG